MVEASKETQPQTENKMKPGTLACLITARLITQIDAILLKGGAFSREFDDAFSTLVTNYALFTASTRSDAHAACLACFPQLNTRWTR